jgi:multiple sugar transport system permease protein
METRRYRKSKASIGSRALAYAILILALVWVLFPIVVMIFNSFREARGTYAYDLTHIIPTFRNYLSLFGLAYEESGVIVTKYTFAANFVNSIVVSSISTVIAIALGSLAAYSLSRFKTGGDTLRFDILSFRMFPPIASAIPIFVFMKYANLLNTWWALIFAYNTFNVPFATYVLAGFFDEVSTEFEESAMVDGCSRLQAFRKITIPIATNGIIAAAVLVFLLSWNEFLFAFLLTAAEAATIPVAATALITHTGVKIGEVSAAITVMIIPTLITVFVLQKFLVKGLTFGAVKG